MGGTRWDMGGFPPTTEERKIMREGEREGAMVVHSKEIAARKKVSAVVRVGEGGRGGGVGKWGSGLEGSRVEG
jgi:hypothetical protein